MRRYSFIGALALVLSLAASPMLGQVPNGPLRGAVQNTQQAVGGTEQHAAGAAGESARHEGNIPPLPIPAQPNAAAGSAAVGADIKQGSEARVNAAPPPAASPAAQADAKVSVNVTGDNRPDQWRYRWDNGRWWYWTPQNRWMWYSDNGGWVDYAGPLYSGEALPYTAAYGSYAVPSGGYYYYPGYPGYYWYGGRYYYRPGVYVGVGGYGHYGHRR
jgi:hypothetical protein